MLRSGPSGNAEVVKVKKLKEEVKKLKEEVKKLKEEVKKTGKQSNSYQQLAGKLHELGDTYYNLAKGKNNVQVNYQGAVKALEESGDAYYSLQDYEKAKDLFERVMLIQKNYFKCNSSHPRQIKVSQKINSCLTDSGIDTQNSLQEKQKSESVDKVSSLINRRKSIRYTVGGDISFSLHDAATRDNVKMVKSFLDSNDVDLADSDGNTAAHLACINNSLKVLQLLIEEGANFELYNNDGKRPLDLAVDHGQVDVIQLIGERCINVNTPNKHGQKPIDAATGAGRASIVEVLMEKGALPSIFKGGKEDGSIHLAVKSGNKSLVELFMKKIRDVEFLVNSFDKDGNTPLHLAAINDFLDIASMLVQKGAKICTPNGDGKKPMELAIINDSSKVIALLFDSVSQEAEYGKELMKLAIISDSSSVVKSIRLKYGFDFKKDGYGKELMKLAVTKDSMDVIRLLKLECDFDFKKDEYGKELMKLAITNNSLGVVELLKLEGVGFDFTDKEGNTPMRMALLSGSSGLAHLLPGEFDYNNENNDSFIGLTARNSRQNVPSMSTEKDTGFKFHNERVNTPADSATNSNCAEILDDFGREKVLQVMLSLNNYQEFKVAAQDGNVEKLKRLWELAGTLEAKEDPGIQRKMFFIVDGFALAKLAKQGGRTEVFEYLREIGQQFYKSIQQDFGPLGVNDDQVSLLKREAGELEELQSELPPIDLDLQDCDVPEGFEQRLFQDASDLFNTRLSSVSVHQSGRNKQNMV